MPPSPNPTPTSTEFYTRHRGPFIFLVTRRDSKGVLSTEWLHGAMSGPEVEEEARCLLADPRDTIVRVHVWSEKEERYVFGYRKEENA